MGSLRLAVRKERFGTLFSIVHGRDAFKRGAELAVRNHGHVFPTAATIFYALWGHGAESILARV